MINSCQTHDQSEISMSTLLLITSAPTSIHAWHAFGLAQALHTKGETLRVFFYQDGVQVAKHLQWFPDDQRHLNMNGKNYRFVCPFV
jgi:tRNA 2-thiouridine synthesizing protein D